MLKATYKKHILNFKFEAGTSRGVLNQHVVYYILIYDENEKSIVGIGEAAPLKGLSVDYLPDFETIVGKKLAEYNATNACNLDQFPSIQFAFETALLDLKNRCERKIFDTDFYNNEKKIPINGLVWMNTKEHMKAQIKQKISEGFDTIKLKIGAINFDEELELLGFLRKQFSDSDIEIRVDANGAFSASEAMEKLHKLSQFCIHSIEQPIKQGQWEQMSILCQNSPIDIALDEELIGIESISHKINLLNLIKPKYIILKPTLLGGFTQTTEWINLAAEKNIKWWLTSALESNIGLNAICQFASLFDNKLKHGLGTGSLYTNNVESPLMVNNGKIYYERNKKWNYEIFKQKGSE